MRIGVRTFVLCADVCTHFLKRAEMFKWDTAAKVSSHDTPQCEFHSSFQGREFPWSANIQGCNTLALRPGLQHDSAWLVRFGVRLIRRTSGKKIPTTKKRGEVRKCPRGQAGVPFFFLRCWHVQ